MKLKNKLLLAFGLVIIPTSATMGALVGVSQINKNNSTSNENKNNFQDNTINYKSKVVDYKEQEFNPFENIQDWQEYKVLDDNPYSENYKNLFSKIDLNLVKNDFYNFIGGLSDEKYNKNFMVNITDAKITKNNEIWDISLNFKIYNEENNYNYYKFNNVFKKISFKANEIKNIEFKISSKLNYTFTKLKNSDGTTKLLANYIFDKASLNIVGNNILSIDNFSFANKSYSLNTFIDNVETSNNYLSIKNDANKELEKLSIDVIKSDVENTYDKYISTIEKLLDPVQNILQNLVTNYNNKESVLDYLKKNADDIGFVIDELIYLITKTNPQLSSIISSLLKNETLFEIISNKENLSKISTLLENLIPGSSSLIESFIGNLNSQEDLKELINQLLPYISGMIQDEKLVEELKNLLNDITTEGLISTIFKHKNTILAIIQNFGIIDDTLSNLLINILEVVDIENKTVADLFIDLIKSGNENTYYLKEMFKLFQFALSPSLESLLDELIFNNPNMNAQNLIGIIDVFANSKVSNKSNAEVVRYKKWFDSMQKNYEFNQNASFDPVSKKINLSYTTKFVYGGNIYFNIGKIYDILPDNLTVNGSSIPISTIKALGALPDWIGIFKNDYFSLQVNLNDKIEYDVVKLNSQDVLSWQAYSKMVVDMHMPQTIQSIWGMTLGDNLTKLTNGIFFHIYNTYDYFKPYQSDLLNSKIIENYDYDAKTNEAIFFKELLTEKQQEISNAYNAATNNVNYRDENGNEVKHSWKVALFITKNVYKTITETSFEFESILKDFIDFTHYTTGLHIAFNNNRIISSFDLKIVGINALTIPNVNASNITILAPYNTYTNNGNYSNKWSISLN